MKIDSLHQIWDENTGYGNDWSGQWEGFVTAPFTGEVAFYGESNRELTVSIDGNQLVHIRGPSGNNGGTFNMIKDELYHIHVIYRQRSFFRIFGLDDS